MMAINRYRLKHLVKEKNKSAKRVTKLLERTDRLLGVILIGNNFTHTLATAIATVIAIRIWSDSCLLYTSPSPRDQRGSRMPSSA